MRMPIHSGRQLGFEALLVDAEQSNRAREIEKRTAHLPATMDDGLPYFRRLLENHHAAMLAGRVDEVMSCRDEAHDLALRLNGNRPGFLADETSPGSVLVRETTAEPGTVPLWGQKGSFVITVAGTRVRIEMGGVFGIGAGSSFWLGFAAHMVDRDWPFVSATGYRSFLGIDADPASGLTPDAFAAAIITAHVCREMRGRLVSIEPRYRGLTV